MGQVICSTEEIRDSDPKYYEAAYELYRLLNGGPTNFTARLISVLLHCDTENFEKISSVYPFEGKVILDWRNARNEKEFFKELGIPKI